MDGGSDNGDNGDNGDVAEPTDARWAQAWAHRALLLRVARRHGADADDAEDAVQEAILRAADHPEIAEDRLRAWLVAVTIRLCMDGHRRRAREASRWQRVSGRAVVDQPGQHPEDEVCERSEAVWVASLAAEILPPRQAQALRLAAAGCDVQQVASRLGVRYRAAESLLARARRTVRTALSTGVGVLVWAWRTHVPATTNPIPMAFASATAATMMVVALPQVLPSPEPEKPPTARPPAVAPAIPAPVPPPTRPAPPTGQDRPIGRTGKPSPSPAPRSGGPASLIAPIPAAADALTTPALPELPAMQPHLPPPPALLGRSGPVTPQRVPALPDLPADADLGLLPEVDIPELG